MVVGKKCTSGMQGANEGFGIDLVRSTSFGRKRVALPSVADRFGCEDTTPLKRQCSMESFPSSEKSALEAFPQDVLVRILCGVDHADLKRLFHVSKAIREATLIAKKWHFEYSTPRKTSGVQNVTDIEGSMNDLNEVEPPNAPKQLRIRKSRLSAKKLADISVALFASSDEENWPRRGIFMETETET